MNTVFAQNKVSSATAKLPEEVKRLGVTTEKSLPNILLLVTLTSDGRYDQNFLGNYALINIKDILEVGRNSKIPTVALMGGAENDGVILTVTADPEEQGKELAEMVKKVIGGAKPSGMAVIKPKKIGVILNMKEAELLGFSVPENIKSSATRIIK